MMQVKTPASALPGGGDGLVIIGTPAPEKKFDLANDNPVLLEQCKVNKTDSEYQIWKRKPLNIELGSEKIFLQKFEYIHYNPVKANICNYPEDYHFTSALFYENGLDHFNPENSGLTHYRG